jgi:hypothetical protein
MGKNYVQMPTKYVQNIITNYSKSKENETAHIAQ